MIVGLATHRSASQSAMSLIGNIEWWQILLVMVVIVVLVLIPLVSWYLRRRMSNKRKSHEAPPLMYITTVPASSRRADVDIPVRFLLSRSTRLTDLISFHWLLLARSAWTLVGDSGSDLGLEVLRVRVG